MNLIPAPDGATSQGRRSTERRLPHVLERARRSSYLRGIATLSGGQALVAIIPFFAAPVLGRIYRPEDYALLAAYVAVVNIAAAVATLHYQHGVLVERTIQRAHQLAWISIAATIGVAALMLPVAIGLYLLDPFAAASRGGRLWFLLLPLSTLVSGASLAAMAVANRGRAYKSLAAMQFAAAAVSALASIVFGLMNLRSDGLMLAYVLSQAITLMFSGAILFNHGVHAAGVSRRKLIRLAVRHRGYPLFTLPAAFLQSLGGQVPVIVLTVFGAAATLGAFSRAQSLLILPVMMFSSAISRVYFQRAAGDYNKTGSCKGIFLKTTPLIAVFAFPFLLAFALFGEELFSFYLGTNWRQAGEIAEIISPVLFLQMFVSPLGSSVLFSGNQHLSTYVHSLGLVLIAAGCIVPLLNGLGARGLIIGWALSLCILNILQIGLGWVLSAKNHG